ncbi:hypothetical protein [Nocardia brevicatena]|uniref:hypothetical protein n=1 Tax=Nocardia brevicatena TaxID=37327 RepID=UPI0002E6DFF5|nr:hypothetical protein [Nocardia brevicatena]
MTALWQDPGDVVLPFDPQAIWSTWASDLHTATVDCGHFLPEEQPSVVIDTLRNLID